MNIKVQSDKDFEKTVSVALRPEKISINKDKKENVKKLNKKFNKEIKIYFGDELEKFLSSINVLVCTVPYTSKTHNLLSSELFDKLNDNTYLINVSRGKVQNEKDIIDYIDNGRLSGAYLDVFEKEPLPPVSYTHLTLPTICSV